MKNVIKIIALAVILTACGNEEEKAVGTENTDEISNSNVTSSELKAEATVENKAKDTSSAKAKLEYNW